jgi:hypothetical protein
MKKERGGREGGREREGIYMPYKYRLYNNAFFRKLGYLYDTMQLNYAVNLLLEQLHTSGHPSSNFSKHSLLLHLYYTA